jgi:hypothetical protein
MVDDIIGRRVEGIKLPYWNEVVKEIAKVYINV